MSKIRILPEVLSNKIAAGEVVERPASVVKELVENALDAGAGRVFIDIEKGGRSLIRVADNGCGMSRDDALLSIERYATSKLSSDADLFAIRTLGFRGEALPSIAAVSRFSLVTREASAAAGTAIEIEGGKLLSVTEAGAPPGTMVTIKQLFFNTPARRKFLKTIATEMGHVAETAAAVALARPAVHFRLSHNGKTVKNWPVIEDARLRAADVLGGDIQTGLQPVRLEEDGLKVSGWVALPAHTRRTSRGIHVFVNGRCVRDRTVQHAIFSGYAQRLVKGQFPIAAIFLEVPFDQVDVNVHPTKHEVRFAQPRRVHDAVRRAVAQILYEADRPRWEPVRCGSPQKTTGRAGYRVGEKSPPGPETGGWKPVGFSKDAEGRPLDPGHYLPVDQQAVGGQESAPSAEPSAIGNGAGFAELRVIGQLANSYIVCEGPEGLLLVDQHAAHERILFEQLAKKAASAGSRSQKLLLPETVELDFREAAALEPQLERLNRMGLSIEPFGGNAYVVRAVPAALAGRDIRPLVAELAEKMVQLGGAADIEQALDACRMVIACHGAIRARQRLDERQMSGLLDQLDACENPSHCPHGRPTWVRWGMGELEKMFKRTL